MDVIKLYFRKLTGIKGSKWVEKEKQSERRIKFSIRISLETHSAVSLPPCADVMVRWMAGCLNLACELDRGRTEREFSKGNRNDPRKVARETAGY